jgi:hypothetical protein
MRCFTPVVAPPLVFFVLYFAVMRCTAPGTICG